MKRQRTARCTVSNMSCFKVAEKFVSINGEGPRAGELTLTGGEPLLQADIARLIVLLGASGAEVEIETNGSVSLEEINSLTSRPSVTADYKLPSSGMEKYMLTENFSCLTLRDAVKFVVGDMCDLARAEEIINEYGLIDRCRVYFSPVFGKIMPEEIVEFMKERKLNGARLQLQLHKIIWKPDMRGV